MNRITSKDGTRIAFEKSGVGPAVILVGPALVDHSAMAAVTELLSAHSTVFNYDRRGRGESLDTPPYAVEREIEDIDALVREAGGSAFLFGGSSGAALALEAAAKLGGEVKKLAMYEAPYNDDADARRAWAEYVTQLGQLLAADRRGDAVALYMKLLGTTDAQIEGMRHAPMWQGFEAIAHTLAYDHAGVLGKDGSIPVERARSVRAPALVMNGSASYPFMHTTAVTLSRTIPHAQLRTLEGQTHGARPEVLAPVLAEFFSR